TVVWLSFPAWLLLFSAIVAYGMALWEGEPLLTFIPGALAFWALALPSHPFASPTLVAVLIAVGAALQQWRKHWWGVALYVVALAGSPIVINRLELFGGTPNVWQVVYLLAFAGAAYLVALQERQPRLTVVSVIYALIGVAFLPGPDNLVPTLIMTF